MGNKILFVGLPCSRTWASIVQVLQMKWFEWVLVHKGLKNNNNKKKNIFCSAAEADHILKYLNMVTSGQSAQSTSEAQ